GHRLITLVGPGGSGKTRLLVEVGTQPDQPQILYADLAGTSRLTADELADRLGLSSGLAMGGQPPLDALVAGLADGRWLLLIDEAEDLTDPVVQLLQHLLDRCAGVQILTTSRRPLALQGEHLMPVAPLDCPDPAATPEQILQSPAVRLLLARLADSAVPVARDGDATGLLAAIAREVDGLPLALELVAAQGSSRSLAELAELVHRPLDVSAAQPPRQPRHRTLRETIRWSTDRLGPRERLVLGRLGVFAGRFELDAARAVIGPVDGDSDDIVRSLARVALLHLDRRGSTQVSFRLLRTVRQLAQQLLDAHDHTVVRARHRRWFADRWRGQPRRDDLIEDVRDHQDDYLEALRTALEDQDVATLADLVLTLSRFWLFARGRGPGLRWTTRVLDSGLLGARERAQVQAQRAALALHHDRAIVLADTAAAIPVLTSHGDLPSLVTAQMIRALELDAGGDRRGSVAAADCAVEVAAALGAERHADALGVQAVIHAAAGLDETAAVAIEQGLALVEQTGSAVARIAVSSNLALALLDLDRPGEALDLLDDVAPDLPRVLGTIRPSFFTLNTGWAALGCGQLTRALTEFGAGVTPHAPPPADRSSAETLLGAACALALAGRTGAGDILVDALDLADQVGLALSPGIRRTVERAGAAASTEVLAAPPVRSARRGRRESADALVARLMRTIADALDPTA
ncbi:MAG: AAA family ATPase, partial [Propionibacteriaceae bacterium]